MSNRVTRNTLPLGRPSFPRIVHGGAHLGPLSLQPYEGEYQALIWVGVPTLYLILCSSLAYHFCCSDKLPPSNGPFALCEACFNHNTVHHCLSFLFRQKSSVALTPTPATLTFLLWPFEGPFPRGFRLYTHLQAERTRPPSGPS